MLSGLLTPEEYEQFLRRHLSDRPVRVEWHRMYQTVARREQSVDQLVTEYRELLDAEPNDSALMYLLGRLLKDPQESEAMLLRSIEPPQPCAYGYNALAYGRLVSGDFEQALIFSKQAVAMNDASDFTLIRDEALHGSGQFETLLNAIVDSPMSLNDMNVVISRSYLLCRLNRVAQAQTEWEQYAPQVRNMGMDPAVFDSWHRYQQALLAYYQGDSSAFLELLDGQEVFDLSFSAALIERRWADAAAFVEREENPNGHASLLLYALAQLNGDPEIAEQSLALTLKLWQDETWRLGGVEQLAQWFTENTPPDESQARHLELMPNEKCVALFALGVCFPQQREPYWALARKLNYDHRPPYLSIKEALSQD